MSFSISIGVFRLAANPICKRDSCQSETLSPLLKPLPKGRSGIFSSQAGQAPGAPPSFYRSEYTHFPQWKALEWYMPGANDKASEENEFSNFRPKFQVGALLHSVLATRQEGNSRTSTANPGYERRWENYLFLYRVRILAGGQITPKTSFFFETEAASVAGIGVVDATGQKKL